MSEHAEQQALDGLGQPPQHHGPVVVNEPEVPQSVAMYRLGGRLYPMHSSPRCNTCQSGHRFEIERRVLLGYSYRRIADSLPEDVGLSWRNIQDHVDRGHMPLEERVKRVAIEERARELGRSVEAHDQSLADHVTLARLGVQKVFERMMEGEIEPDIEHGIAFGNMLMKLGMFEGSDIDRQAMMEAFGAYMEAAEEVMSPDQMREFGQRLANNDTLRGLLGRPRREDEVVVEAEDEEDAPALGSG